MDMIAILASVLFLVVGLGAGFFIRNLSVKKEVNEREAKGDEIIKKAKDAASDIKYKARKEAKEVALEEKKSHEAEMKNREKEVQKQERDLVQKETKLDSKLEENTQKAERLVQKENSIEDKLSLIHI